MSRAEMAEEIIVGESLRKSYGGKVVLDLDRIAITEGETLAVLGPSGSGKSTLLSILGLLIRPDAGRVLVDGRAVHAGDRSARMNMAAVFQRPYLFKGTVARNVAYGLKLRGVPRHERAEAVASALERVGLGGWENRSVSGLSGGEAQRVALARALVLKPRVLLLDEPLSSLDPVLKARLSYEFGQILGTSDFSALYVTHDQDEAMVVASRMIIVNAGRIVSEGDPDHVMGLPTDAWTASFVGMEAPLEGVVTANVEGTLTVDCGGTEIYAVGDEPPGSRVVLGVRPEDVLVFEKDDTLPRSSARNVLPCRVVDANAAGTTMRVILELDGLRLASTVTRSSARSLGLEPGREVLAVFKASATRVASASGFAPGAPGV